MRRNTQSFQKVPDGRELESLAFEMTMAPLAISQFRVITHCNRAFARLFGHPHERLVGCSFAMLFPSYDDFAARGRAMLRGMREDPEYHDERLMMRGDKTVFWCAVRGVTLTPDNPFKFIVWNLEALDRCAPDLAELTPREREVASYIGDGLTSKQIGQKLGLSHRTVERHRARIMRKLGTPNAAALTAVISSIGTRARSNG